jgi:hypothetical protein
MSSAREFFFAPPPTEVTMLDEPQLGAAAAAAAAPADLPELMGWAEWKAAFGRAYGPAEEARRAATFARTIEVIVALDVKVIQTPPCNILLVIIHKKYTDATSE